MEERDNIEINKKVLFEKTGEEIQVTLRLSNITPDKYELSKSILKTQFEQLLKTF